MRRELKKLQNIYLEYLKKGTMVLPRIIHIETRSKCNGLCGFCPASATTDKRKDIYMPDEFIKKIINELHELNYPNRLSFYNNNEPFLDERIFKIIKLARNKLPKTYLELKSNGKVLTTKNILRIFNFGLDMLYINDYSSNGQFNKNIQEIRKDLKRIRRFKGHLKGDQYFNRIKISLRGLNIIKRTRAGNSPNKQYKGKPMQKACFRPFEMMTINPKGDVSVCSEDFYCTINMGNIRKQTLFEIWTSKEWNDLRNKLLIGDRSCTDACSKCDYKGFTYEALKENGLYKKRLWSSVKNIVMKFYNLVN